MSVPQRRGDPIVVDTDEGVRPETTVESLAALRPAFEKDGTITAGNASQISDGGAAVVVMSQGPGERARRHAARRDRGLRAGRRAGHIASPPAVPCDSRGARRSGLEIGDLDLFEINEAFAAVGVASMDDLGVAGDIVNVNGGAIALGHPIGMSGTRLAITVLYELQPAWRRSRCGRPLRRWRPGGRRAAPLDLVTAGLRAFSR